MKTSKIMTEAEYQALPEREKDALVAEHVFGEPKPIKSPYEMGGGSKHWFDLASTEVGYWSWVPRQFTQNITSAWQVVEKMLGQGYGFWLESHQGEQFENLRATFGDFSALADTTPLAICLAALKAKGVVE